MAHCDCPTDDQSISFAQKNELDAQQKNKFDFVTCNISKFSQSKLIKHERFFSSSVSVRFSDDFLFYFFFFSINSIVLWIVSRRAKLIFTTCSVSFFKKDFLFLKILSVRASSTFWIAVNINNFSVPRSAGRRCRGTFWQLGFVSDTSRSPGNIRCCKSDRRCHKLGRKSLDRSFDNLGNKILGRIVSLVQRRRVF